MWIEFAHTVMRPDVREALPEDSQRDFAFDRWSESLVRQTYLEAMRALLETFFSHFPLVEVPLSVPVRSLALQNIAVYNLGAQDAAHLASASETGVLDLA